MLYKSIVCFEIPPSACSLCLVVYISGCPLSILDRGQNIRRRCIATPAIGPLCGCFPIKLHASAVLYLFQSVRLAPKMNLRMCAQLNVLWLQIKLIHAFYEVRAELVVLRRGGEEKQVALGLTAGCCKRHDSPLNIKGRGGLWLR